MKKNIIFLMAIFFTLPLIVKGQSEETARETEIGIVERLDEYIPDDIYIINTEGEKIQLVSLFDKPTALAIVYYRCPGICSPFMTSVADVMQTSNLIAGKDYQVLNISFDPREGPLLSTANKTNYHQLIKKDFDPNGWQFFTTDSINSKKLTEAVGFRYKRQGMEFMHTSAMIFVSDEGKITRYLHGTYFLPMDLKLAVVETAQGKSGPSMSRLLTYCYSYDPAGQAYVFNVTKVTGSIMLFLAAAFFLILVLRPKRKHAQ